MQQSSVVQRADGEGASGAGLAQPVATHGLSRRVRGRLLIGSILVVAVAGAAAYWGTRDGAPVHYTTAPVTRGGVERAVSTSGTVNPVLTIIVGSYVSGVIVPITIAMME